MNEMPAKLKARAERKSAKRDEKKRQIAASAITALQELGYANTSLRDIAAKSDMSLGILHYYFEDRSDLIIYCVRIYKQEFVGEITTKLKQATGRAAVIDALSGALAISIAKDSMTHRLWYDIRNQALFDETFRPVTSEIEAMLAAVVALAFERAGHTAPAQIDVQYALLDGVFRFLLQDQLGTTKRSASALKDILKAVLEQVL
ncbi:TetR/AcrR family transcriptional regulator [Sulfitobacter sp. F26204]|uniref:TetR/AcrR family transcriptional regulator n=1 Tax=Sulfitobacter sp. F26204 TaxID=2996014 RepID=UPI00225E5C57|nr:TetR/AcrR family transcriptional regulator [Sulfitobacter sp. F26204]MCX7560191.1 TetR/AcrR family transcriptional regulator [Sulfitobacter sp. F26204]